MEGIIALIILFGPSLYFYFKMSKYKKMAKSLQEENEKLRPYQHVIDADKEAEEIIEDAEGEAKDIIDEAKSKLASAEKNLSDPKRQADAIILKARKDAHEIAGEALKAKENAEFYEKTATAMKNLIDGYGDEYIIPSRSILDDLADTYGYTQASEDFKKARALSKEMVKKNQAAACDYVEQNRATTACNFTIDAFNGKVDSILSKVKTDNYGKLKQQMIDAFHLVNQNGRAFRDARITTPYFNARLRELELAVTLQEIRQRDIEEQRRIKEQIREEEKARREIEKALRESAKQEEILQKAMEKVKAQMAEANEEQRASYEAQIAELEQKWKEAEERNQRALSMAQQTKSGHVYIVSNIGSFGEDVFKIGMTRRLEPLDRIKELGDASVPFSFDVHAMIWSENAPELERQLHKRFALDQINKVNYRKEFFKTPLQAIREELEKDSLEIQWTMTAEAREYRESNAINELISKDPQARQDWLNRQFAFEQKILSEPLVDDSDAFEDDE